MRASSVCSVTGFFAPLRGGTEAFWGNPWRGGERRSLPYADMVSSALSWTAEANVLGIRVLLEMAGVRGVRKVKGLSAAQRDEGPFICV